MTGIAPKKRVVVAYEKLTPEQKRHLGTQFPEGFDDEDFVYFQNATGDKVKCITLLIEDTLYLVKISTLLKEKKITARLELDTDSSESQNWHDDNA